MNDPSITYPIPTNIITGFLGAGKTTAIRHLLKTKPNTENWAVLVNEFGEIGIDGAIFESDNITVKEVAGGCICCSAGLPSKRALNQLVEEHRLDRIIIEPTGLAFPQQILEQFRTEEYRQLLDFQAIVCLLDPWSVSDVGFQRIPAFQQQIASADILIATKSDQATPEQLIAFDEFCKPLAKDRRVDKIQHGHLPWQWLNHQHVARELPSNVSTHTAHSHHHTHDDEATPVSQLVRKANQADFGFSCGWEIPVEWRFDKQALVSYLSELDIPRIKGVILTESGWVLLNKMRDTLSLETLPAQEHSRLEMIALEAKGWQEIELKLLEQIQTKQAPKT